MTELERDRVNIRTTHSHPARCGEAKVVEMEVCYRDSLTGTSKGLRHVVSAHALKLMLEVGRLAA